MSEQSARGHRAGVSVAVTADAVGLSKITVLRRLKSGAWPGGKSGRKWLVSAPFVDALTTALTTTAQVDIEDFAAAWMTKSSPAQTAEAATA